MNKPQDHIDILHLRYQGVINIFGYLVVYNLDTSGHKFELTID